MIFKKLEIQIDNLQIQADIKGLNCKISAKTIEKKQQGKKDWEKKIKNGENLSQKNGNIDWIWNTN